MLPTAPPGPPTEQLRSPQRGRAPLVVLAVAGVVALLWVLGRDGGGGSGAPMPASATSAPATSVPASVQTGGGDGSVDGAVATTSSRWRPATSASTVQPPTVVASAGELGSLGLGGALLVADAAGRVGELDLASGALRVVHDGVEGGVRSRNVRVGRVGPTVLVSVEGFTDAVLAGGEVRRLGDQLQLQAAGAELGLLRTATGWAAVGRGGDVVPLELPWSVRPVGVAGGRVVVQAGASMALLHPGSGHVEPVAEGVAVAANDWGLATLDCADVLACQLRVGPWGGPVAWSAPADTRGTDLDAGELAGDGSAVVARTRDGFAVWRASGAAVPWPPGSTPVLHPSGEVAASLEGPGSVGLVRLADGEHLPLLDGPVGAWSLAAVAFT